MVKAEANGYGTQRRFVVTNRRGAALYPEASDDDDIRRGARANRNKERQRGLAGDRRSDQRFVANYLRLYLHSVALHLRVRLRQRVAVPCPVAAPAPAPASVPAERRRRHNERRRRDPLGERQPGTWRLRLIKVAAEVVVRCRRGVVRLSASWPYRDYDPQVCPAAQGMT